MLLATKTGIFIKPTPEEITLFSEPRLKIAYNENMEYYYANIYESAEISKILQVFEVALRNYVDNKLTTKYNNKYWIYENIDFESLKHVVKAFEDYRQDSKKKMVITDNIYNEIGRICKNVNMQIEKKEEDKVKIYDKVAEILNINNIIKPQIDNTMKVNRYSAINDIILNYQEKQSEQQKSDLLNKIINMMLYGKSKPNDNDIANDLGLNIDNINKKLNNKYPKSVSKLLRIIHKINIKHSKYMPILVKIINLLNNSVILFIIKRVEKLKYNDSIFEEDKTEDIYTKIHDITMNSRKSEQSERYKEIRKLLNNKNIQGIRDIVISRLSFGFWLNFKPMTLTNKPEFTSFYDDMVVNKGTGKNEPMLSELKKVVTLRNRCSHEERIIETQKDTNGNICYVRTQDTKEAIDAIKLVGLELFKIDVVNFCLDKIKGNYNIQK